MPVIHAATCPFIDNDGNDANAGVGTYQLNTNFTVTAAATAYDCTSAAGITTFIVPSGVTLTLDGNVATGEKAQMNFTNFTVNSGGIVSANGEGCGSNTGPNSSNICGNGGGFFGYGNHNSPFSGGGGHGGAGGAGNNGLATGGAAFDSATLPAFFGAGGGFPGGGGTGGGMVRVSVTGTMTHNGLMTANGTNGLSSNYGGGSGGSIYLTVGTMAGTTGTFSATGGNAASANGGGGGAGRVAITYASNSFSFDSADFTVTGGTGFVAGGKGTVFVNDTTANTVAIYHGFTYTDTDYSYATWTFDPLATSQACDGSISTGATPSITTTSALVFDGAFNCGKTIVSFTFSSAAGVSTGANSVINVPGAVTLTSSAGGLAVGAGANVTSAGALLLSGSTTFSIGTGATIANTTRDTNITFTIPAGVDQTWTNVTINGPAEGDLIISSAVAITLAGTTAVNANVLWTNLTDVTVNSTATITVTGKGCLSNTGPNGSNVCGTGGGFQGYGGQNSPFAGGGGHGGAGGAGDNALAVGGAAFDSATAPAFYGAGGGFPGGGGNGGGRVRVSATGTMTLNGTIITNGTNGVSSNYGGGSGGSVYLTVGSFAGTTGTVASVGGNGASAQGGGGGGGRVAITFASTSFSFDSGDFSMGGGTGFVAGAKGTVYVNNTGANTVQIFHGFTYTDTDYAFASWITDTSATNQYCDSAIAGSATPSISAATVTFGGTLNCTQSTTSFVFTATGAFSVSASGSMTVNSALTLSGGTGFSIGSGSTVVSTKVNTDMTFTIPAGADQTWTNVTVTVARESDLLISSAVSVTLAGTTTVNANVQWTNLVNLTIGASAAINANSKGCAGDTGPNGSNTCGNGGGFQGYGGQNSPFGGGGGHGGAGGAGNNGLATGGAAYDSLTSPVLYGAGGGISSSSSGIGGGAVRLNVSGTMTHDGSITARGGNGVSSNGGGGAGGTIFVTTGVFAGTSGSFATNGGNGVAGQGGGGGGGRVSINYAGNTSSFLTGLTAAGVAPGGTGFQSGSTGTLSLTNTNPPPTVTVVSHSPASPFTTDSVTLSGTATDNAGIVKIEIFLDGTAPANLKHTCNSAPTTPANCQINVGQLSGGSHTTTVRAYDAALQMAEGTETFSVGASTLAGQVVLGRSKAGVSTSFTLSFALSGTSTGTLTVTFPAQFTVTAAGNSGASSACLSGFSFTSTTLTATKTGCSGTVTLGGATITNPATPGTYVINWTNDSGSVAVYITADDQVFVNAAVDPVLTFNVGAQASATACDGTFVGNGGTVALGSLTTSSVSSSDASSVPHICTRITTNATNGAVVTVRSLNASLRSTSAPADAIPSSTTTLVAGTAGYGMCAGSAGADSGRDATTPVGAAPLRTAPFNGASCTSAGHDVGGLTTNAQNVWTVAAASQNAFFRLYIKAAISASTPAHSDYTDTLTFVATGTY